ncbi:MAG: hypothetical protein KAG56_08445 [Sulfurovaceae bacterium]|nr:hypothetical protein [Sulfurovaceae bacterium]
MGFWGSICSAVSHLVSFVSNAVLSIGGVLAGVKELKLSIDEIEEKVMGLEVERL